MNDFFKCFIKKFENEFVFDHDSLTVLSQRLLPKTEFPSGYTVTVHECATADIVYGFQINNASPDILPCRGRSQPPGCYTIEFVFQDLYARVEQEKADVARLTEESQSLNADAREANPTREEPQAFKADSREATPTREELQSFKVGTQEDNLKSEEPGSFNVDPQEANPRTTAFDYPSMNLIFSGVLVLLVVTFLIGRFRKTLSPVPAQNQDHTIVTRSAPEAPPLGKFLFDAEDQRLLLGSEIISLTEKECRILELLYKNFGELIPRETLMQKVWISEGVITGRSLDMFVSKLRKKLSSDPELRIMNVHGKGYKLEIPGMQI